MSLDYFIDKFDQLPEALLGTLIAFVVIILYTRLYGLKSFSKMTSFDFAITIAIGSLIASALIIGQPSLVVGIILIGFLFSLNFVNDFLRYRFKAVRDLTDNTPLLLMRNGEILYDNMQKAWFTEDELRSKLREANVLQLSQVKAVVLETTGDVSVLHTTDASEVDEYLLQDVRQ